VDAYVHLKNGIFVNAYMIKSGLAAAASDRPHRLESKFKDIERNQQKNGQGNY